MRLRGTEDEDLVERVASHAEAVLVGHRSRLVAASDAVTFVAACKQLAIEIVGIEGFMLEGGTTTPQPFILDLSRLNSTVGSIAEAEAFIREASIDCNAFEFDLAEPG